MWIVRLALRRPYTFVVMALLIAILGVSAIVTMPVDIFPYIDIPVVSIVWNYSGLSAEEMEKRMVTIFERAMTTTVNDIEHIESQSYSGVSVTRVYFQPNAKIEVALSQVTAIAQTLLKIFPPGTTPPSIIKYDASSVPILQLGLESSAMSEQELFDMGQNFIRTQLATIQGAAVPLPYGGKFRAVMVDLNPSQLFAKGLAPADVSTALGNQNLILPAGDMKIADKDYTVQINSSPRILDQMNALPVKVVNGATVYLRDVAQVHDGFNVQTSIVRTNGTRGALLTILRSGQASTLAVVNRVKAALPKILAGLPPSLHVRQLFDQSLFVRAAIAGVVREAVMAAFLTGLMILMFLGSWRSTVIVCISIPLSILVSLIVLSLMGQTINVMTLGGLALAVGILVDDATVEIENTHRNMAMKKPLVRAVLDGAQQIAAPAFVSTLSICIVFVPVLLLTGAAKYLFTPLAMAVVFAMMASYLLSRTLIPTMVHYMLKPEVALYAAGEHGETAGGKGFIWRVHYLFNRRFELMRSSYTSLLHWCLDHRAPVLAGFGVFIFASMFLAVFIGRDFFPTVDSGQMRLHARAPAGTRLEETELRFAAIEDAIREVIPPREIDTVIDNIGIPNGGFNLAFGDSPTIGTGDGDILISLKEGEHGGTADYIQRLRKRLHERFPDMTFFFEAANITNQILNFGLPAPIDVQVVGRNAAANYQIAQQLEREIARIPGAADVHIHQVVDWPQIDVDVDRAKAGQVGLTQRDVSNSLLISLSGSGQIAPTQWLDFRTGVSYFVTVQTPQYRLDSMSALLHTPIAAPFTAVNTTTPTSLAGVANAGESSTGAGPSQNSIAYGNPGAAAAGPQLLANLASVRRDVAPEIINHYNVQPVYDIYANLDRRDLGGVGGEVEKIVGRMSKNLPRGTTLDVRGQVRTMQSSFYRLGLGMAFAVVLVYLLMAVNFQSWLDPFIILMALPGAMAGIVWMLFLTQTTFSVPSLMGAIMCIGVATANSILMVVFANDQRAEGMDARSAALAAGHTRIRPVLMTASAMIIGMLPMALGMGEGGEQNAPLGRAVIGGLLLATVTTLFVVPLVYSLLRTKPPVDHERRIIEEEHEYLREEMLREDLP
ncbi:MAG TPA: efflux RND transporter permease subunit [Bryobacteraceae bacterium]|nr:efflux RND transporter permease subunit [Bryobacteraceae bacterium]